jgi:hypothetical protein
MADGSAITTSASGKKSAIKDPDAVLDFSFDWSDWLAEVGDTIIQHAFNVTDPDGATVPMVVTSTVRANGIVTAFVSGGTVGKTHALTCRITTGSTPPRIDERTLFVKIRER